MVGRAAWSEERASSIILNYQTQRGALLPMLHALHDEFGCIEKAAVRLLAKTLNLSRAEVHGVVSFYHDFRETRAGRHMIKICRAEACQAMGADALIAHAERHLSTDLGSTTNDDAFSLEAVYCLGNCALSPAVMIDKQLHGRVDATRFDALISAHGKDL